MANREKGEESVEIDGKRYTLRIDMHAWALAQDVLTKGDAVPDMALLSKRMTSGHMLSILAVFWAALQRYHAKDAPDLREATALFEKSGGPAAEALVKAVSRSSAAEDDLRELSVSENPPQAQGDKKEKHGAGDKSTSRPAVSV